MYCLLYICIIHIVNIYVYIYCKKRKGKRSCRELLMVVVSLAHNHSYYILHKIIIVMTGGTVVKNPAASAGDAEDWVWSLGCADPLKEEMAAHSSILAWRIPWTKEPNRLWSIGMQRVRHDWATELNWTDPWLGVPGGTSGKESACQCRRHKKYGFDPWVGKIPWRRKWQPIPVFLAG